MTGETRMEEGRLGRLCVVRLKPNQDLTEGVEAACRDLDLAWAVIRAGIGSLNDAHFDSGGRQVGVSGPGLEILTLSGEIAPDASGHPKAELSGAVCDAQGKVMGGRFRRGENIICITLELMLQEWLPSET
jgi:predicted DNA-binding protein with PD1-like motif